MAESNGKWSRIRLQLEMSKKWLTLGITNQYYETRKLPEYILSIQETESEKNTLLS